jgi:uncharacterized protein
VHFSHPIFLFLAALVAGLLNSVAGGGSFISFPALLFAGVPPIPANATNTAAVWPGTVASAVAYRKELTADTRRLLPPLVVVGAIGGLLGAIVLLRTPPQTFMHLVPWLLLIATLLFVVSGRLAAWVRSSEFMARWTHGSSDAGGHALAGGRVPGPLLAAGLALELPIAFYVGYFGAGVGILILALLALMGLENIHAMNALKTVLVSVLNGVAFATFVWARAIVWPQAVLMIVGASIGGYAGAHFAQKMDPRHVRWAVIAVGFSISAYFFLRQ